MELWFVKYGTPSQFGLKIGVIGVIDYFEKNYYTVDFLQCKVSFYTS